MQDVNIMESNLTSVKFLDCDFTNAVFDQANLTKADFTTSRNYTINPNVNKLKKAAFAYPDVLGLLQHLDIVVS